MGGDRAPKERISWEIKITFRPTTSILEWAKNLYAYALAHFSGWSVPSPQLTLETPLAGFEAALAKLSDPNYGKVDMERKKDTHKVCEKGFRVYV
jgi:hypothetical protein